jgi:hypothetical protein
MGTERKTNPNDKQGGGYKAATLFCVASAIIVILTLVATHLLLGPRDRIIGFVPGDAVAYVHAQGNNAVLRLSKQSKFVPETTANEIGLFALNLDEEQVWTAALMWNRLLPPTGKELELLEMYGALKVSPTFYILRTGRGPIILSEGWNGSLKDKEQVSDAFEAIRSVSRIQAYLDSAPLLAKEIGSGLIEFEPEPVVLALLPGNNALRTLMMSVPEAAKFEGSLGFRLPDDQAGRFVPPIIAPKTEKQSVSFASYENLLDPIPLLFHKTEALRTDAGIPDSSFLESARTDIRKSLSSGISLTMWPGSNGPSFAAHLPDVDARDLKGNILTYLSASFPKKQTIKLPDGQNIVEYVVEPEYFDESRVPNDETGLTLAGYPIQPYKGGAILASDIETLDLVTAVDNTELDKTCISGNWPTLSINDPEIFLGKMDIIRKFLDVLPLRQLVIQRTGDNIVYFCGY